MKTFRSFVSEEYRITVAAVKKTKHGGYGKQLTTVMVTVPDGPGYLDRASDLALPMLQALLPGLKITTDIVKTEKV